MELLGTELPLIKKYDFKKSPTEKWQIRKLRKDWQIQVAKQCNMLLYPGNWHNIYNVYKSNYMQRTTVLN